MSCSIFPEEDGTPIDRCMKPSKGFVEIFQRRGERSCNCIWFTSFCRDLSSNRERTGLSGASRPPHLRSHRNTRTHRVCPSNASHVNVIGAHCSPHDHHVTTVGGSRYPASHTVHIRATVVLCGKYLLSLSRHKSLVDRG